MAEGLLRNLDPRLEIFSAVAVMKEIGIEISRAIPKSAVLFSTGAFDYVITVCDHAEESCPVFTGAVAHRVHMGFEDPVLIRGTSEQIREGFRRSRNDIREALTAFYEKNLRQNFQE
jgi:arsenate reductase